MTAPIRSMPELVMVADQGEVIATVRRHQDIADVFRLMKERLGITNEFIDDAGGLTKGHTDKILGPSESKNWGPTTFDLFCEMFAIEFRVHIDMDAVKRMEAVWEGRERPLYPNAQVKRISKKLIERAKPHVLRESARAGGIKRAASLPAKLRSSIARKGGKSRMRKVTRQQRCDMAKKGWDTRRKNRESQMSTLQKETQNQSDERVREGWIEGSKCITLSPQTQPDRTRCSERAVAPLITVAR